MASQILTKTQLHEVIQASRFKIEKDILSSNLDEISLVNKTAEAYGFTVIQEKIKKILNNQKIATLKEKYEGAVLQIKGEYSVKPEFSMKTDEGFIKGELFVFHETKTNKLHKKLSKKLIEEKAVELFPGCDEEYLYEALSETTENYLYETLKKVAVNLPIYVVNFDEDATFTVKEMGTINDSE